MINRKQQVLDQLRVCAHLGNCIAEIHEAMHSMGEKFPDDIVEIVGARTAYVMGVLGDILSEQDALTEEDEWTDPIFEKAQELWPVWPMKDHSPVVNAELLEMVRRYASECINCAGCGKSGPEDDAGECTECADIRALIAKAEGG